MESKGPTNLVEFEAGDFLVKENGAGDSLYIIRSGQLEVYKTDSNGDKIPLAIIGTGEYVGESAVLYGTAHTSNVVALTKVTAVRLSKKSIDHQLKQVPGWLISLTKGLITRLRHTNDLMRKNGLVDESLAAAIKAAEKNAGFSDDGGSNAA